MKDDVGRVIYIGKAKNLRSRAGSYFTNRAIDDSRISNWLHEINDIDFMECASEADALLTEVRLIKDIQPPHNKEQRDDKSFPYIMITNREDYPRVEVTREPPDKNVRLMAPLPVRDLSTKRIERPSKDLQIPELSTRYRCLR